MPQLHPLLRSAWDESTLLGHAAVETAFISPSTEPSQVSQEPRVLHGSPHLLLRHIRLPVLKNSRAPPPLYACITAQEVKCTTPCTLAQKPSASCQLKPFECYHSLLHRSQQMHSAHLQFRGHTSASWPCVRRDTSIPFMRLAHAASTDWPMARPAPATLDVELEYLAVFSVQITFVIWLCVLCGSLTSC
jgi:hypothetical protein